MREVSDAASPSWTKMTKEEKAPFEEKAKMDKSKPKQPGERYTSLGVPLSDVLREKEEGQAKKQKQKEMIDKMLEKCITNGSK